jgi:AraC-like DNA-binding protein
MTFEFNAYSTPLLFGFVQGWLYAVLFWVRGWRQGRLSDLVFGCLSFALSFEIWEYMLGFAGNGILWEALNFFPRNFGLLVPPLAYFYLKSQVNADFRFSRRDLLHALPFALYVSYHVLVFVQGPDFVKAWNQNIHFGYGIEYVETGLSIAVQAFYFYHAYRLYVDYRRWAPSQFSDVDTVSFRWFRNFLLAFVISIVVGWLMTIIDIGLNLDFWHDWWDELFNAGLIYYITIEAYAQKQLRALQFSTDPAPVVNTAAPKTEKINEAELQRWKERLETLMRDESPYLDPELTLPVLAQRLGTNASILSAVINGAFGKNFNDFVNTYRVEAVKKMMQDPANSHYSLLGIGLACGFNSKSTFNRVFKKMTGVAPSGGS